MFRRLPTPAPGDGLGQALYAAQQQMSVEVWPENWRTFELFARVRTQWSVGMNGATGLRYEAVYPLIDRAAGSPDEWDEIFAEIQVMEAAALTAMSES